MTYQSLFRQLRWWIAGFLLVGLVCACGWRAYRNHTYRLKIKEAESLSQAGRVYPALLKWRALSEQFPGDGEVEFQRALLAMRLGRESETDEALNRVPQESQRAPQAAILLGRRAMSNGRLSKAETALQQAVDTPGPQIGEAARLLARVLTMEGRYQDALAVLKGRFALLTDPIEALREIHELERGEFLVDKVRPFLTRSNQRNPADTRVELGLAQLDVLEGKFDEAERRLARCETQSPGDRVVGQARLNWAIAAGRADAAVLAFEKLPEKELDLLTYHRMEVWAAACEGAVQIEKLALEHLLADVPADPRALERLAELCVTSGDSERGEFWRNRKAQVDEARTRYRELIYQLDPAQHAGELARISAFLGHPFEARQWRDLELQRASTKSSSNVLPVDPKCPTTDSVASLCKRFHRLSKSQTSSTHLENIPRFLDLAEQSGLRYRYNPGSTEAATAQLPQAMGSGVALFDFDGDGWLDVFFTQGGEFPPRKTDLLQDRLFRNKGKGAFEDVTETAGLSKRPGGYGFGVTAADYDGDGWPDLFLTRWNAYALYRNRADGTFEDVTEAAGLGGSRDWPSSSAFCDLDGDGDLDLYVCHYLGWAPSQFESDKPATDSSLLLTPLRFPSMPDHLFRNDGGRFVDVTAEAGIIDRDGRGLGVVIADLDGDGRPDIYVANDMTANFFFHNNGDMKFTESARMAGLAANAEGGYQASMGIAAGDQDGDGRLDLAVTNFYLESTTLYHNLGKGMFADHSAASGMALATRNRLGFGVSFLDADNDGHLDVASANGHIIGNLPGTPYQMAAQLLLGRTSGRFIDVTPQLGAAWNFKRVGRALASGDLDNDGRMDVVVVSLDTPVLDLRNQMPKPGHFITLALTNADKSCDAIGAEVTVTSEGQTHFAVRYGGGSYQSSNDPRLHFGLGSSRRIESVEVKWPKGKIERFNPREVDRGYLLVEGSGIAKPLPNFAGQ